MTDLISNCTGPKKKALQSYPNFGANLLISGCSKGCKRRGGVGGGCDPDPSFWKITFSGRNLKMLCTPFNKLKFINMTFFYLLLTLPFSTGLLALLQIANAKYFSMGEITVSHFHGGKICLEKFGSSQFYLNL